MCQSTQVKRKSAEFKKTKPNHIIIIRHSTQARQIPMEEPTGETAKIDTMEPILPSEELKEAHVMEHRKKLVDNEVVEMRKGGLKRYEFWKYGPLINSGREKYGSLIIV